MENQNNWIIDIIDKDDNYGLFVSNKDDYNIHLGDLEKIKYDYIEYKGKHEIKNIRTNENIIAHYFSFDKEVFNIDFLKNICIEINKILEKENKSIQVSFEKIIQYFSKLKFQKDIGKKIIGDIAEALFMIKGQEILNINFKNDLRLLDNELYDFKHNDTFIEVKSATKKGNQFIMSLRQYNESKNKKLVIVKFTCLKEGNTILDLYEMLNPLPSLLMEKKKKWMDINANSKNDILNRYSVNIANAKIYLFDDKNLPKIDISEWNAMKDADLIINATDSELISLENLKNYLK